MVAVFGLFWKSRPDLVSERNQNGRTYLVLACLWSLCLVPFFPGNWEGIDCERLRGHRHGPQRPEPQEGSSCLQSACSRAVFNPWPGWDLRTGGLDHDSRCTCAFQTCVRAQSFSHVRLFATPRTVAHSVHGISDKCPQIVYIVFLSFSCLQSWLL